METLRTRVNDRHYLFPLASVARVFEEVAGDAGEPSPATDRRQVIDLVRRWGNRETEGGGFFVEIVGRDSVTVLKVDAIEGISMIRDQSVRPVEPWWFEEGGAVFSGALPEERDIALLIDPPALLHSLKGGS